MAGQNSGFRNQVGKAQKINVDLLAITIALTLAALIRFNILPHIGF
jgi:hypothetical protein